MSATFLGMVSTPRVVYAGTGFFAGLAPAAGDPESPDGRFRILNVPSRGRITLYERAGMIPVEEVLSGSDGTWLIERLDPSIDYVVIGWDGTGAQNAAIQDWVRPALPE